jgi:Single-strand binding protein family
MTRAIVSGALHKSAEERTSKAGSPFSTFTVTEKVNGATRWWKGVAFTDAAISILTEMAVGEPISVAGEIDCELWTPDDGRPPRLNWKITVDGVLSAHKPKPVNGRETAAKSWAASDQGSKPVHASTLDDAIPFACSWR